MGRMMGRGASGGRRGRRSGDGGAAIVNSILLPSSKEGEMAAADLKHGEQPWSPFHSVFNVTGNFREVIDVI